MRHGWGTKPGTPLSLEASLLHLTLSHTLSASLSPVSVSHHLIAPSPCLRAAATSEPEENEGR